MSSEAILLLSVLCGTGFGYAAQRGSICVISGIESLVKGGSPRVFLSFFRCSIWVVAISLPLAWASNGYQFDLMMWPTWPVILGGALFGAGAAINGGCSFGTMIRLGSGDVSFCATLFGIGLGIVAYDWFAVPVVTDQVPSFLEAPSPVAVAILVLSTIFCLREIQLVFYREEKKDRLWTPERAALVMGISGGLLFVVHGSWEYTVAIKRGLAVMMNGGIANFDLALIFLGCIVGAGFAAKQADGFLFRLNLSHFPKHLLGGLIMGFGAAAIPGGNDSLILHSVPALSPHAFFAYLGLTAGATAAITMSKLFGVKALAETEIAN